MKIIQTVIFFFACGTSVYFFGRLLTWAVQKINPDSFDNPMTKKEILNANLVMIVSIFLWSILFYLHL